MATRSIIDYKKTLTKDEIIKIVEENNIEFIKLEFCDINGTMKNLSIPSEQLESAMEVLKHLICIFIPTLKRLRLFLGEVMMTQRLQDLFAIFITQTEPLLKGALDVILKR